MLCDEPGLGKTITLLALILKRCGSVATVEDIHEKYTDYEVVNGDDWMQLTAKYSSFDGKYWKTVNSSTMKKSVMGNYCFRHQNSHASLCSSDSLLSSPTTLIIVPPVLREQWKNQIEEHVRADVLNSSNVFIDKNESLPLPTASELSRYVYIFIFLRLTPYNFN